MWDIVATEAVNTLWAIAPATLDSLLGRVRCGMTARTPRKLPRVSGNVAVIPINGMISQKASIWGDIFGGTSAEQLAATTQAAARDSRVKAIIYDVDSPGGTVSGVQDAADVINSVASSDMPVAAVTNSENASAAYWLSSQVGAGKQRFAAARGSYTGSIGVFRMHVDQSEALEREGIKVTFISTPEYKVEGNPFEPISEEALAFDQSQIDDVYEQFVRDVGRGRGVSASRVKSTFGKGRMFGAEQAAEMGLVDRVASLSQLLSELGASSSPLRASSQIEQDLCHVWETGEFAERIVDANPNTRRARELELKKRM